jgi:nucleotide-binding universal stress UspA family protein
MKRIVVPVDFSENSAGAAKYAAGLAKKAGAQVTLLHVFETPVVFTGAAMLTTAHLDYSSIYNDAVAHLKKFYQKIRKPFTGVKTELTVLHGLPSARIAELAMEKKADLVVMGTTGKGLLERWMLGSNAARMIADAPCPVLLVPPKSRFAGLNKLVYTTDLSDDSLDHAAGLLPLAKTFNAEILFLYINDRLDAAEENMQRVTQKIKSRVSYPKISGYICNDSDVNEGIAYFARRYKPQCIVMYTRHRGLVKSLYNKSKTRKMASHMNLPLLVLHAVEAL